MKINQRIAEIPGIEKVFVFPNMTDGGIALGAAYLSFAKATKIMPSPIKLEHVYLGPSFSEVEIMHCLQTEGISFLRPDNMPQALANYLSQNKIVARFAGAMEYGPRALGNRSILYPATNPSVNDWLNRQLKRTEFMPFAPKLIAPRYMLMKCDPINDSHR